MLCLKPDYWGAVLVYHVCIYGIMRSVTKFGCLDLYLAQGLSTYNVQRPSRPHKHLSPFVYRNHLHRLVEL